MDSAPQTTTPAEVVLSEGPGKNDATPGYLLEAMPSRLWLPRALETPMEQALEVVREAYLLVYFTEDIPDNLKFRSERLERFATRIKHICSGLPRPTEDKS